MEAIELLGGMVNSVLEFPLVGFLGRLVPVGGSEAGQQVSDAYFLSTHHFFFSPRRRRCFSLLSRKNLTIFRHDLSRFVLVPWRYMHI